MSLSSTLELLSLRVCLQLINPLIAQSHMQLNRLAVLIITPLLFLCQLHLFILKLFFVYELIRLNGKHDLQFECDVLLS